MKYLCLVYLDERKLSDIPDRECADYADGLRQRGTLVAAEPLFPTETATTVRVRNGMVSVTDGPFAETKEQLAGFYLMGRERAPLRRMGDVSPQRIAGGSQPHLRVPIDRLVRATAPAIA